MQLVETKKMGAFFWFSPQRWRKPWNRTRVTRQTTFLTHFRRQGLHDVPERLVEAKCLGHSQ